jgi:hypothetical protein
MKSSLPIFASLHLDAEIGMAVAVDVAFDQNLLAQIPVVQFALLVVQALSPDPSEVLVSAPFLASID